MVLKFKIYTLFYLFWPFKYLISFFFKPKIRFVKISSNRILILPPFCMSSAFKKEGKSFYESTRVSNFSEIFVLKRPDSERFRSCYQKKIYSAVTLKKILLLIQAGFKPFMNKEDFVKSINLQKSNDFHFLTIKNILKVLNVANPSFIEFNDLEMFCKSNQISYPVQTSASSQQINKDFLLNETELRDIEVRLSDVNY